MRVLPSKKTIVSSANLAAKDRQISGSRRSRSKDNTRRKLIDAALLVISEKGVDGTAIADITEKADVGFGSFYNYFSSKKELVSVVFAQRAAGTAYCRPQCQPFRPLPRYTAEGRSAR